MDQGGPGREKGTGAHCRELMFIRWDLVCRVDSRVACRAYILNRSGGSAWIGRKFTRGDTDKPQSLGQVDATSRGDRFRLRSGAEEQAASLPVRVR